MAHLIDLSAIKALLNDWIRSWSAPDPLFTLWSIYISITNNQSISQLCYHMRGSALRIELGVDPLSTLWLAQTHHMTFGSRSPLGSGSGADQEWIGSGSGVDQEQILFWASDWLRQITWEWIRSQSAPKIDQISNFRWIRCTKNNARCGAWWQFLVIPNC